MIFATATAGLLRMMRRNGKVEKHCVEGASYEPFDFDTVMDEKAGLRLATKEYIDSNDDR